MAINFEYYKFFYYVAKYQNFTTAAQVLYSNQPSVTRYIHLLEAELGCLLFIRSHQGVSLTPEGRILYQYVEPAYRLLTEGEEKIQTIHELAAGTIYIDATSLAIRIFLLNKLIDFRKEYPNIKIHVTADTAQHVLANLVSGKCEFSLVSGPVQAKAPVSTYNVQPFQDIFIAAPGYIDSTYPYHIADLQKYPFIALPEDNNSRCFYEETYRSMDLSFHADIEMSSVDLLIPLIQKGMGIGIIPNELVRDELAAGTLIEIPIIETIPTRYITIAWDSKRAMSLAARKFFVSMYGQASAP